MSCSLSMRKALANGACAVLLAGCAVLLSGCGDVYEETCVWHSDLNIKGCDYYGFKDCVHHCTYCVTADGPDECGQLKCAAYCAQRNGDDDCRSHFKQLCSIAVQEQTHLSSCDVDCSSAGRVAPRPLALLLLLGLAQLAFASGGEGNAKRIGLLCGLAVLAATLHGCCDDPEHQLDWDPDFEEFKTKADWYDENGIWRGNPTWRFTPLHEAESYECKAMHESRPICVVWTTKEWNCGEQDFGVCKCHELPTDGEYCQAWGCHSLEADQKVCRIEDSKNDKVTCAYNAFPMDESKYYELVSRQESGQLTTGETVWWSFSSVWLSGNSRLLSEAGNATEGSAKRLRVPPKAVDDEAPDPSSASEEDAAARSAPARMLQNDAWPPAAAYNPAMRWQHFNWGDVCIANGDNVAIVMRKCHRWREIETEISHCVCKKGAPMACVEWSCEERDVGLFSVLFRTSQPIADITEGTEQEEYKCKKFEDGPSSRCVAWEGDISSLEEVEWTRCECVDGYSCHGVGAVWKCDEYELPKTRSLFFHENREKWTGFILAEILVMFLVCKALAENEDAIAVGCCCSWCVAIIIFPFLMVTFGVPGFLLLGLPFWTCRCGVCACLACKNCNCGRGGTVVSSLPEDSSPPEDDSLKRSPPSGKDRFKRGASAIIGRRYEHNQLR